MLNYFDSVASQWDNNPLQVERAAVTAQKIKALKLSAYDNLIDFGCGTGLLGVQLRAVFTQVHLADSSAAMLKVAENKIATAGINNIQTHQVDKLSELSGVYSAIATLMTLHHIVDIQQFFDHAYARLSDTGVLMIADLFAEDGAFHLHNPAFSGHNGFVISELNEIAERSGFIVESVEPYYQISQANFAGEQVDYPLFFMVAQKRSLQNIGR